MKTQAEAQHQVEQAAKKVAALRKQLEAARVEAVDVDDKLKALKRLESITPADLLKRENWARRVRALREQSEGLDDELADARKALTAAEAEAEGARRRTARECADENQARLIARAVELEREMEAELAEHRRLVEAAGGGRNPFAHNGANLTALERLAAGLKETGELRRMKASNAVLEAAVERSRAAERNRSRPAAAEDFARADQARQAAANAQAAAAGQRTADRIMAANARAAAASRARAATSYGERSARHDDSNVREVQ